MGRNRLEDFGRILVKLENQLESPLFQQKYWSRPKDSVDWFCEQTKEKQEDVIHEIAYSIQDLEFSLCEIRSIAAGWDELNETIECQCKGKDENT